MAAIELESAQEPHMNTASIIDRKRVNSGILVSLAAAAIGGQAAGQALIHTIWGQPGDENFGEVVSGVGDFDGDGWRDFAVAAVWPAPHGIVRVYSGTDGSVLHEFTGGTTDDHFGRALDGGGDLNGDGIPDIAIGAQYDSPGGQVEGSVWVYSGGTGAVLLHLAGSSSGDNFGSAVAFVDDVNADGHDELLVGAMDDAGSSVYEGSATLFSGLDGSTLFRWEGEWYDLLGVDVAGVGDVNADGFPDVAASSLSTGLFSNVGYVRVYSGRDGAVLHHITDISVSSSGLATLGRLGDADGDGYDDILIGNQYDHPNGGYSGTVRVFSGRTGAILHSLHGYEFHHFGSGVDGVGDRDGDGLADFAVGASGEGGGSVQIFSGQSGEELYVLDRGGYEYEFGSSVRAVGDVDKDGGEDILVGAPGAAPEGKAMLYSSTCYRPETYCILTPNSAGPGARIGYFGSQSISTNDFHLTVADAPPGQFGLFFLGKEPAAYPFGDGLRCVGSSLLRLDPPGLVDGSGGLVRHFDFTAVPHGHWMYPACTRYFQFWFRDPNGPGGTGFNLSDGLKAQFCL